MSIFHRSENIYLKKSIWLLQSLRTLQRENSSLREELAKDVVRNFVSSLPISSQEAIKKFVTILETYFASAISATPGPTQTPKTSKRGSSENSDRRPLIPCPVCGEMDCPIWGDGKHVRCSMTDEHKNKNGRN